MDGRNADAFPRETVTANLEFFKEPNANLAVPLRYPSDFPLVPLDFPSLLGIRKESFFSEIYKASDSLLFVLDTEANEDLIWTYQEGTLRQPSGDVSAFFPSGPFLAIFLISINIRSTDFVTNGALIVEYSVPAWFRIG